MPTTQDDIRGWIARGKAKKAAYLVVWCDTFDYGEYPGFYPTEEEAQFALNNPEPMAKAMECYNLNGNLEKQIKEPRSWALKPTSY